MTPCPIEILALEIRIVSRSTRLGEDGNRDLVVEAITLTSLEVSEVLIAGWLDVGEAGDAATTDVEERGAHHDRARAEREAAVADDNSAPHLQRVYKYGAKSVGWGCAAKGREKERPRTVARGRFFIAANL